MKRFMAWLAGVVCVVGASAVAEADGAARSSQAPSARDIEASVQRLAPLIGGTEVRFESFM